MLDLTFFQAKESKQRKPFFEPGLPALKNGLAAVAYLGII
jgi:hypothetical protein